MARLTRPGTFEVKTYPAYRGAVVRARDAGMGSENALFYPLFLHISRQKVAMTSPVINSYDPVMIDKPGTNGVVAMEFVYRTPTTGTTGPGLGMVVVEDHPEQTYLCLGVQGDLDATRFTQAVTAFRGWLTDHQAEWVAMGPPRRLGYHPPMIDPKTRLWNIQLPVQKVEPAKPVRSQP